ncbi:MAG: NUDIX hydrolase [Chlorobiaceae bacterium]|nr:NUDIX hydrolase [Chlorobiaceae bacterium]
MANETENLFLQSGVLPLTGNGIMLITARRSGKWIIPKGHIEKGMTPAESAAKEAWEEAGVRGTVGTVPIGSYRYRRSGGLYSVEVYPLHILEIIDDWKERAFRRRMVVSPDEALGMLFHDELRTLVAGFFARRPEP